MADAAFPHDLYVVSDLHMGRGLNASTRRFHRLETFFYDSDFRSFARWVCAEAKASGRPFKLILNGDVFDLLRVEPEDAPLTRGTLAPATAAVIVDEILRGHPAFVDGIAEILLAGHEIVQLPGNHDLETQWAPVQDAIRRAIAARVGAREPEPAAAEAAAARLHFAPWFFHEEGRIWVEHGCQYDPDNAFRYLLRSDLPSSEAAQQEAELDMPLGNFVQRYLYNHFGAITFIVPSTRAHVRYFKWMAVNKPGILIRVISQHVPFGLRVARRLAKATLAVKGEIARAHEGELARLAQASGLGDKLRAIDELKVRGADAVSAVAAFTSQFVRTAVIILVAALAFGVLRSAGYAVVDTLATGVGLKTLLNVSVDLLLLALLAAPLLWILLRIPGGVAPRPLRRASQAIVRILDVPVVTFGHTHEELVEPLERSSGARSWYFNTGTWIAVFTHDILLPRERVQFTFLRVRGNDGELLYWSAGRGEALPVVLIEERSDLPLLSAA